MKIWNLTKSPDGKTLDITLYGVIGADWFGPSTDAVIAQELAENRDATQINVHINSVGGDVFGGIAIYNMLRAHPAAVTCIVEGLAASAASIVAMAGKTVMCRGAMMMIHNPWACVAGAADDMRAAAEMLDKIGGALATVYEGKTGKGLAEIKTLLDAETWMTADEAVKAKFADEIAETMAVDPVTAPPEASGEAVVWNGVKFPRAALPAQIFAMAKPPAPTVPPAAPASGTVGADVQADGVHLGATVLALVPPLPPQPALTRAEIANRAPEILAALVEEGRAAGVTAERARIQAIDELGIPGCADLIATAKYGPTPSDAPTLAMAVVKAGKLAGAELLALRRTESAALANVTPSSPDRPADAATARVIAAMTHGGNATRGDKK